MKSRRKSIGPVTCKCSLDHYSNNDYLFFRIITITTITATTPPPSNKIMVMSGGGVPDPEVESVVPVGVGGSRSTVSLTITLSKLDPEGVWNRNDSDVVCNTHKNADFVT